MSQTLDAVLHKGQTMPEKNRFPAVLQPVAFDVKGGLAPHGNPCVTDTAHPRKATDHKDPQVICFSSKDYGADASVGVSPTLRAGGHAKSHANAGVMPALAYSVALRGREGGATAELGDDLAGCLRASTGGGDKPHVLAPVEVLPFDTTQITSAANYSRPRAGDTGHPLAAGAHPPAVCVTEPVTHTLKAEGFDASEDGTGRGQPIVTAFQTRGSNLDVSGHVTGTLGSNCDRASGFAPMVQTTMAVRRLMPVECEALQGFPADWTKVPVGKNKDGSIRWAADGPRYKQCGNSMATKVMAWIGARIVGGLSQEPWSDVEEEADNDNLAIWTLALAA